MNSKVGQQQKQRLEWRRDKVRELSVKGKSVRTIASILKIPKSTVDDDLQHLRTEARNNIKHYVDEYLPAEYENCLEGLNNILEEAWQISSDATKDSDKREKMQALSLAKDCYAMKLDLLSSATVIDRAVRFVDRHRGLIPQNKEVMIDNDSAELIKDTG